MTSPTRIAPVLRLAVLALAAILLSPSAPAAVRPPPSRPVQDRVFGADTSLSERLHEHVSRLAGVIGERHYRKPQALQAAADYIRTVWQKQGYRITSQHYPARGVPSENLSVECKGATAPEEIILVGAHYDSASGAPGADDNASGVAALLEIGRTLANERLRRTVRLVAFANEEAPFFFWSSMGSSVYARAARRRGDNILFMLSLEMLGAYTDGPGSQNYPPVIGWFYPDRGNFIAFVSDLFSLPALKRTVRAFRAVSDFPSEYLAAPSLVPGVGWSDHLSFWRQGYQALMVTDTAFYRYQHYHQAGDIPDKLDYVRMARVVDGLAKAIVVLANDQASP